MNHLIKVLHQIAVEMDNRFQEMIINNNVIQQTAMDQENLSLNHQNQQIPEHMHQQQLMHETIFHHMDHFNHPPF